MGRWGVVCRGMGGVGVRVGKDGETVLESPGGQSQGRQRHMETEKGTQGEIEPRVDREPQKDTARNTESQRHEVCSQSPGETEKYTHTDSQSQKVRGRRPAGAGGGQGRAAPSRPPTLVIPFPMIPGTGFREHPQLATR